VYDKMSDEPKTQPWWIESPVNVGLSGDVMLSALVAPLVAESQVPVLMRKTPMRVKLFRRDPRIRLVPPPIKRPPRSRVCRFQADWGALERRNVVHAVLRHHGLADDADTALPQIVLDNAEIASVEARYEQPFCIFSAGTTDSPRRVDGATWRGLFNATPHIRWYCGAHRQIERFDGVRNVTYEGLLLGLREYIALVRHASLVVSIDGSLSHIAMAVDTPAIVLQTGNSAQGVFTWPGQTVVAPVMPECAPCYGAQTCLERPCTRLHVPTIATAVDRVLASPRLQARPAPDLPRPDRLPRKPAKEAIVHASTPSYRQLAMKMIRTVVGPRADKATFDKRMATCRACVKRKERAGKLYCGSCGCAQWPLAELDKKLWFANLECPLGRFGKAGQSGEQS